MTTPAMTTSRDTPATNNATTWPSWSPSNVTKVSSNGVSRGAEIQLRPESSTMPFRANQTRGPGNWYHSWCAFDAVPSDLEIGPKAGKSSWCYKGTIAVHYNRHVFANLLPWYAGTGFFPVSVDQAARTKFLQKLAGNRANLGQTLGELRQTARGVTSLAADMVHQVDRLASTYRRSKRAIVQEIRHFGRVPVRKPANVSEAAWLRGSKEIRKRWLEYQMGIKPLFGDIEDVGNALSDAIFNEKRDLLATIRAGHQDVSYKTSIVLACMAPMSVQLRHEITSEQHMSAVYRIPVSGTRTLGELGLGNPYSVAWELTQFSWMADYVVGVGGWLDSLFADAGTSFVEGSVSRIQRVKYVDVARMELNDSNSEWKKRPHYRINGDGGHFQRSLLDSRILPPVMPVLRNRVGLTQMANVLSVLSQMGK